MSSGINQKPITIITGASVVRPGGKITQESIVIEGSKILRIDTEAPGSLLLNRDDVEIIQADGHYLTCGLLDQHINGAYGIDFADATLDDVKNTLNKLPGHGITRIVPTIITAPITDLLNAINTLEESIHLGKTTSCRIVGIHLEGPLLNPDYAGIHPKEHIQNVDFEEFSVLFSPNLKLITLAPEMLKEQPDLISQLTERGIHVAAGHSGATMAEMKEAMSQGLTGITHLYNAMRPFHHREPGIVGTALVEDGLYIELIPDGVHISPETTELVFKSKPHQRIILTSDAIPAAGLGEGDQCRFAEQLITVSGGKAQGEDGTLAGGTAMLNDCIKKIVNDWQYLPFETAITMASENPARFLGLSHKLGKIETGYDADLVLWKEDSLDVAATWVEGQLVYNKLSPTVVG